MRANDAAVLGFRDYVHRPAHAHVPIGGLHFMQQENIDVIGPQLFAETIEVGFDVGGGGRIGLGEDDYFVARDRLQCLAEVGVAAVLVGGIPEVNALVVRGAKELGDALIAEFARLVGTAVAAVRAGAHGETAELDAARPEGDPVCRVFLRRACEQVIRERVERDRAERAGA
ncbi:MAG: hypothetical protein PVSMB1_17510 [Gemmatimonadaceae bacterium]